MAAVWSGILGRSLFHRFVRRRLTWRGPRLRGARSALLQREREGSMRWIGLVGHGRDPRRRVRPVEESARDPVVHGRAGASRCSSLFAFLVLYWDPGEDALERFSRGVSDAIGYADQGASFLFGWLAGPQDALGDKTGLPIGGFVFAFKVLPRSSSSAPSSRSSTHFGIIQKIVQGMAWVMQRTMKVSGAESLSVAANVFIGQTEAPVLIAPYIARMTTLGAADPDDRGNGARLRRGHARLRHDGGAAEVPHHGLGDGGAGTS